MSKVFKYTNGNLMKDNVKNKFDEYFTKPEIAQKLFDKFCKIVGAKEDLTKFIWIEPSVGNGAFFEILPQNKIGIDIKQTEFGTIQSDFLAYNLPKSPNQPFIVIGNPPFGHRGVLALEFIKHAANADFVAFILPMFFFKVWAKARFATECHKICICSMRKSCLKIAFIRQVARMLMCIVAFKFIAKITKAKNKNLAGIKIVAKSHLVSF